MVRSVPPLASHNWERAAATRERSRQLDRRTGLKKRGSVPFALGYPRGMRMYVLAVLARRIRCLPGLAVIAGICWSALGTTNQIRLMAQAPPARQSLPSVPAVDTPAVLAANVDETIAVYRKIIVLMDNAAALDAGNHERVRTAAWILFEQNRERIDALEGSLRADSAKNVSPLLTAFLTRLERDRKSVV